MAERKPRSPKRARKQPAVANPEALATAEAAAEAVGLTLQELCDLLVDNGFLAIEPEDGITERYTLEDLGKRLWAQMQARPKEGRAPFFARLSEPQQTALMVTLRNAGFATETIAKDFEVDPLKVIRAWNHHGANLGAQVVGMRLDTIAGHLQLVAERAQEMARDKGDAKAFWSIHKEYLEKLQSIGIVDKAIHRIEVTHKIEDEQAAEIDKLIALESKKLLRFEEVKQLEIQEATPEALPAEVRLDYDEDPDDEPERP